MPEPAPGGGGPAGALPPGMGGAMPAPIGGLAIGGLGGAGLGALIVGAAPMPNEDLPPSGDLGALGLIPAPPIFFAPDPIIARFLAIG